MLMKNIFLRPIEFYDTTLRDGAQTRGIQFSLQDKLNIIDILDDFGLDFIECGWNGSNATDTQLFNLLASRVYKKSALAAFSSTCAVGKTPETDKRFQLSVNVEVPVITMFSKFWDFQITQALNTTIEHNLELIGNSVSYCKRRFDKVIIDAEHFFDGYKANQDVALSAVETALSAGADRLVLCDTNGGTMPSEVAIILSQLNVRFPHADFGIHCHNDTDMAVANSIIAIEHGAVQIQGTINGIGERCGNTNLCSIIPSLLLKYGVRGKHINLASLEKMKPLADSISLICHRTIPSNQPYVGDDAFTHKAGVHISSVLKYAECYEHVRPESVGNSRHLPISEQSGRAAVKFRLEKLGYEAVEDKLCQSLLQTIKQICHQGVLLDDADASLELLIHQFMSNSNFGIKVQHMAITELHSIHSERQFRLEIAINVHGNTLFFRGIGLDLYLLCSKLMGNIFNEANYKLQAISVSVDRVDAIEENQKRVFVSFVQGEKLHKICTVEKTEMHARCRAIIDTFIWNAYQQSQEHPLYGIA
jgi:2-isopropylmalate synthase